MPDGPAAWTASELALLAAEGSLTLHAGDDPPGRGEVTELGMVVAGERLAILGRYRDHHYQAYPGLSRIRLHWLWTGLHLGIAAYGLAPFIVTLAMAGA